MQQACAPETPVEPPPALCTRGMTRKGQGESAGPELQDGAAALAVKGTPRGQDKQSFKSSKLPKPPNKDPPKDMVYYAQKLSGTVGAEKPSRSGGSQHKQTGMQAASVPDHWGEEEGDCNYVTMLEESQAPEAQNTAQPTLADILKSVNNCTASVNTLKEQFGGLREDVSLLRQDLQKIRERTTAVESRVSEMEDHLQPIAQDTRAALQLARDANDRAEDLENRLRHNNVRIVGLPEKVEGKDPAAFVENWLIEIFGKNAFSPFFAVECRYRVPSRPPPPGGPPRSILARLLHYQDREAVMRQAREQANIQHNGTRVSFLPGLFSRSPETQN